jgi:parallel beta-helix repeat protein
MKRNWLVVGIILLFMGTSIIPVMAQDIEKPSQLSLRGDWLYVGGSGSENYTRIQDAIDNASDGDTVFVYDDSSPYSENIKVWKSINLIGENDYTTIIDGGGSENVINISADWVNISTFMIKNSSWDRSGIYIDSNNNTIKDNTIMENGLCGIRLNLYSRNNNIYNNYFSSNRNCITLYNSSNNKITGNSFNKNFGNCIYLKDSSNININSNKISDQYGYKGIVLDGSTKNNIIGNSISSHYDDDDGIYLLNSNNNTIIGNTISSRDEESISLYNSNYNTIMNNNINLKNKDGIYLSTSKNNVIIGNTITSTYIQNAIHLYSSNNNNISGNSFLNSGLLIEDSYQNNVLNNSCNGKPVVYLEGEFDTVINIDAGQVILVNCDNITVKNQELSNTSVGIQLLNTHNNHIYDNKFFKCRIGIFISDLSSSNLVTSNDFRNNIYSIQLSTSSNITINNNTIAGDYIDLYRSSGIAIDYSDNNSIIGNNITVNMWGIYLSNSVNNMVSNNTIFVSGTIFGEYGIGVWGSENNVISFNMLSSRWANGITLESWSHNNLIFKNNIIECGGNGIFINGNYASRECENNVISENNISHNSGNGIYIFWGCNFNLVEKNNISFNGGNGISLSKNCEYTTILRNKINSNGNNGILIDEDSNHTNISANNIIYNKGSGVFITKEYVYVYWNSDYVTISENNISYNEKWGVYLDGNYHRVIANNFIKNGKNAFFIKRKPFFEKDTWCKWSANYWDDSIGNNYKSIKGRILLFSGLFIDYFVPWFQFDWHPAQEPYDTPGVI